MTTPQRYKVKPLTLEAVQFSGIGDNWAMLSDWTDGRVILRNGETMLRSDRFNNWHRFKVGDYIVKDAVGEFHIVPHATFEATYDLDAE